MIPDLGNVPNAEQHSEPMTFTKSIYLKTPPHPLILNLFGFKYFVKLSLSNVSLFDTLMSSFQTEECLRTVHGVCVWGGGGGGGGGGGERVT